MATPKAGDVIVRGSARIGYLVKEAMSLQLLYASRDFDRAVKFARTVRGEIWQQVADEHGRPLSKPLRLHTHIPRVGPD